MKFKFLRLPLVRISTLAFAGLGLSACETTYKAPDRTDPLSGLVPSGFVVAKSSARLADTSLSAGIAVVVSTGTQKSFDYARARTRATGTDLVGTLAKERAGADPRHSVVRITEILKDCFGNVEVHPDFRSALATNAPVIALIDVSFDFPFMDFLGNKAIYDIHFYDRHIALIQTVSVQGVAMPNLASPEKTFSEPQFRAAQALQSTLSAGLSGRC
jgi:hypothetical protein